MRKPSISIFLLLAICLSLLPTTALASDGFIVQNGVLTKYVGSDNHITIPSNVAEIGRWAFAKCSNITSIEIPNGVTKINNYAFAECSGLTSVDLPSSLTYIGAGTFCLCTSLSKVNIPNSVSYIGTYAFENCTSLTNIVIPDSVTELGYGVFADSGVTSITFPENISVCDGHLFKGCTALTSVTFPTSGQTVKTFRNWTAGFFGECFEGCSSLKEINNVPCIAYAKRLATNQSLIGWLNPGHCVTTQSERFINLANEITMGLDSDYQKAEAIVRWVAVNITYDRSASNNSAEQVLDNRRGVCEGFARLTEALLNAVDIPAMCVMGRDGNYGNHMWNYLFVDGRWIWADPTWGMEYFDASIFYLSASHDITAFLYSADIHTPSEWAQSEVWDAIVAEIAPNELQSFYREDVTREEFCHLMITVIEKTSGQSMDSYLAARGITINKNSFTDTTDAEILAAYALGIINGSSKTTFNPDGIITRQAAAAMLSRTAKLLGLTSGSGKSFQDANQFAPWASECIDFVSSLVDPISGKKVMGGNSSGNFAPLSTCTREQAIVITLRLYHCLL